jgi:hypothetical protein
MSCRGMELFDHGSGYGQVAGCCECGNVDMRETTWKTSA